MGDEGPHLAASHDAFLSERRDMLLAEIAEQLGTPEEDIHDLINRVKKTRNWFVAHTSGKVIEDLEIKIVRKGNSVGVSSIWFSPVFLSDADYAVLLEFCLHGVDVLSDWLKDTIPE